MRRLLVPAALAAGCVVWVTRVIGHPANWYRHLTAPHGAEVLEFPLHRRTPEPPRRVDLDPQRMLAAEMSALAERDAQGDR